MNWIPFSRVEPEPWSKAICLLCQRHQSLPLLLEESWPLINEGKRTGHYHWLPFSLQFFCPDDIESAAFLSQFFFPQTSRKGLQYLKSSKLSAFFTLFPFSGMCIRPLQNLRIFGPPLSLSQSRNLTVLSSAFGVPPSPSSQCWHHMYMPSYLHSEVIYTKKFM